MENGHVELDGVIIPYCEEGDEKWYPIKYVVEQFLLKSYSHISINDKCNNYIKRYTIDYTFKGTSPQETYCMNKDGWIKYLSDCKLNKNKDINKLIKHNILCDYFGCDNKYEIIEDVIYDDYMKDCINNVLETNKDIEFKKCLKCGREFPLHINFFPKDDRVAIGFTGSCNMCKPSAYPIKHANTYARRVYKLYGNDAYLLYINDVAIFIEKYNDKNGYEELCLHTNTNPFMKVTEKEVLFKIIKKDYKDKVIKASNLNVDFVLTKYKIKVKNSYLTNNEINEYCSDNDCKLRPWKYPCYKLGSVDFETGKDIIHRYIEDNNINIENIFQYDYNKLLHNCKLTQFLGNILDFIVKYYDYKYGGYKFKIASVNYYKDKNNRIFDMKWLIEKDLKIEIHKIPLYVTLYLLNREYVCLYYLINKKKYYDNLFEWINECYPNIFNINDFVINNYRDTFDSLEESQVNDQLKTKLTNIIYNQRNTERTINIQGMLPDWVSITEKGCLLIEFFGMYNPKSTSTRHIYYINKMQEKIEKYKELEKVGYNILFIYPEDIKHNFEGLHKKLNSIIA